MKRYVHASFDSSIPDWLRRELSKRYDAFRNGFLKKNVALDRVQFLDYQPQGASLPIYLLNTDYGTSVYAPGINDDSTSYFNGRQRKFGSLAKSSLMDRSSDVVWIDLEDPNSKFESKERYQDPRYSYRNDPRGKYAGQYKRAPYLGHNEYGPEEWSKSGMTPSNESRARDKSGYKVPSPEQKIADYYNKFPERVTNKVDTLHDRLVEVRQEVIDVDLDLGVSEYGEDYLRKAYYYLSEAIRRYRDLLASLDENRMLKGRFRSDDWNIREFSKTVRSIQEYLDDIEEMLDKVG